MAHAHHFHYPSHSSYWLSHSVGLPLMTAQEALTQAVFMPWQTQAADAWPHWLKAIEHFRHGLAQLLTGAAEDICPQSNVSSALTKILHAFEFNSERPEIVLSELDFPSLGFVLQQAQKLGYQLRWIKADQNHHDFETWAQVLSKRTAWVLISHVQSNTGTQLPVPELVRLAQANGARTLVDVAQSIGILPINVTQWQADFVLGSCVKWLCGGAGAGFMWVNPQIAPQAKPVDVGWFSHENPFEFDIKHFSYQSGAQRFWGGTPSVLPYALAAHSIEFFAQLGIAQVRKHNLTCTDSILAALQPQHIISPTAPELRSGTLVIHMGNAQERFVQVLQQEGVNFDVRLTGVRLSAHIYTQTADVNTLLRAIERSYARA